MRIGNVTTENNVFLAPMAGVTDLPFRLLCKECDCGLLYTEMVSAKGILYNNENTKDLLLTYPVERPIAVQIFGSSPEILAQIALKVEEYPIDIIDINMGCPAPKIVRNNEGSGLMKNPKLIGEIVKAVSSKISKPLSIKIRKGFDNTSINAVEIAKIVEENGASSITVHGRTREEYYSGCADWDIIYKVKQAVSITVIGNGDVTSPVSAKQMLDQTGCDAVMIGRAAQGNPWIFKQIVHYLNTGLFLSQPTINEKVDIALRHCKMLIEYKGDYIGIREMRKHLAWYTKGINDSAKLRVKINKAESLNDIEELLLSLV